MQKAKTLSPIEKIAELLGIYRIEYFAFKRRSRKLADACKKENWRFDEKPDDGMLIELAEFSKKDARIENLIHAKHNKQEWQIFEFDKYHKQRKDYWTVYHAKLEKNIPSFTLRLVDRIDKFFSKQEDGHIEFPEDKEFTSTYHISSSNYDSIIDYLDENKRNYLKNNRIKFIVETSKDSIFFIKRNICNNNEEVKKDLDELENFLNLFKGKKAQ